MHTMKRRLPWQYWVMIAAGLLAIPMIWFAVHRILSLRHLSQDAGTAPATSPTVDSAGRVSPFSGDEKYRWATPADYVKDHLPRVANQPWSAPVFDQVPVKAQPDLLCIEYDVPAAPEHAAWKRCSCYTEQVTPYELHSLEECRRYARYGVYNPRRPPVGGDRYADARQDEPTRRSEAGAWQPDWRTRSYVQPERTQVTAQPATDWGN